MDESQLENLLRELMQKDEKDLSLEVLKTPVNAYGRTVAHEMAYKEYKFTKKEILKIAENNGWTVAHEMIGSGYKFDDPEILKLATEYGWTVAHEMAKEGWEISDKEILKLANGVGWTVAHEMAWFDYTFEDKEILKLSDKEGWTVAHEMAKHGYLFTDKEILKWATKEGWTVAHEIARRVSNFADKEAFEILDGKHLASAMKFYGRDMPVEITSRTFLFAERNGAKKLNAKKQNDETQAVSNQNHKTVIAKKLNEAAFKLKKGAEKERKPSALCAIGRKFS